MDAARPGTAAAPPAPAHLRALTGLRFVAAAWVVALHAFEGRLGGAPAPLANLLSTGWVAVSLFFVLSGFILAATYGQRPRVARGTFWVARAARVYPVYLLALALALPSFAAATLRAHPGPAAVPHAAGVGAAVLALVQSWFPNRVACAWNCPGWSLSDEAFFYLVFPFVLPRLAGLGRRGALAAAAAACWAASWLAVAAWGALTRGAPADVQYMANYVPVVRLPEFVLGVAVGLWFLRGPRAPRAVSRLAEPAAAAVAALSLVTWPAGAAGHRTQLLAPLFAVLILALAYGQGPLARLLAGGPLVRLGEASYALYLLHVPVHSWMWAAGRAAGHGWGDAPWFTALYFAVCVAVSIPVYAWLEEPARKWLRQAYAARGRPRAGLVPAARAGGGS